MEAIARPEDSSRWGTVAQFAVHVVVGTMVFCLLAAPAIGLSILVHLRTLVTDDVVIQLGIRCAEYALFGADLVLFVVFLIRSVIRAARNL